MRSGVQSDLFDGVTLLLWSFVCFIYLEIFGFNILLWSCVWGGLKFNRINQTLKKERVVFNYG
jgi:hypothetical protein